MALCKCSKGFNDPGHSADQEITTILTSNEETGSDTFNESKSHKQFVVGSSSKPGAAPHTYFLLLPDTWPDGISWSP